MSGFALPEVLDSFFCSNDNTGELALVFRSNKPHDLSVSITKDNRTFNLVKKDLGEDNFSVFELPGGTTTYQDDDYATFNDDSEELSGQTETSNYTIKYDSCYQLKVSNIKYAGLRIKEDIIKSIRLHKITTLKFKDNTDFDEEIINSMTIERLHFDTPNYSLLSHLNLSYTKELIVDYLYELHELFKYFNLFPVLEKVTVVFSSHEDFDGNCDDESDNKSLNIINSVLEKGLIISVPNGALSDSRIELKQTDYGVSVDFHIFDELSELTRDSTCYRSLKHYRDNITLVYCDVEPETFYEDIELLLNDQLDFRITNVVVKSKGADTVTITLNNKVEELNLEKRTKLTKSARK